MAKALEILGLIGFLGFTGLVGGWESTYTRETICIDITDNVVSFEDNCGFFWEWEIEKGESFEIGETYKLVMDNNHTFSIYDDWIKKTPKKNEKKS